MHKKADLEKKLIKTAPSQQFTEEFSNYLKEQSLSAAFNGRGIETFGWYKKTLGIGC